MKVEDIIQAMSKMIDSAAKEGYFTDYIYFKLPNAYQIHNEQLLDTFKGYTIEYFNDELMDTSMYLSSSSFYLT
jgi:hypothetical protein